MTASGGGLKLAAAAAAASACIYFPQPLAARIQTAFDVSAVWGAMPMTAAFIALALGPVLFGRLITVARAMRIVIVVELVLALLFAAQALAGSLVPYFAIRALQVALLPLLIPAILTGSANILDSTNRARDLALYTAGTIAGGVAGRLVALGSVALGHWQLGSLAITVMLLLGVALLRQPPKLADDVRKPVQVGVCAASAAEKKRWLAPVSLSYPGLALAFAALTTVLTCLPFEVGYDRGGTLILAVIYSGYAIGIGTAIGATAIVRAAGGLPIATLGAAALFTLGLLGVVHGSFATTAAGIVALCGSMVFLQATQVVLLNNHFARSQAGTANAMFVAAFFAGGTFGSSIMVSVYERLGWSPTLAICLGFAAAAGICVHTAARRQALSRSSNL